MKKILRFVGTAIVAVLLAIAVTFSLGALLCGCSSLRGIDYAALQRLATEALNARPETPEPIVEPPAPAPGPDDPDTPLPPVERINKGGDGLYKPESSLWLIPRRNPLTGGGLPPSSIGKAGEFSGRDMAFVKWLTWPRDVGPCSSRAIDGTNPATDDGDADHFHGNGIKLRGAKVEADGNWLMVWDVYDQLLFRKQIQERGVRQE